VLAAGWTYSAVREAVRAGRLVRPHRGVLERPRVPPEPAASSREEDAEPDLRAIRSALLVVGPGAVVSHDSAAVVTGQWNPANPSDLVHLTRPGEPGRLDHGMRIHRSRLPPSLVTLRQGLPVTTVARTAVDIARGHRLPEALVALDGAARVIAIEEFGLTRRSLRDPARRAEVADQVVEQLRTAYESVRRWPGSVVVRESLELVDLASESPFESRSRGWMRVAGLPHPVTCLEVRGRSGRQYFADFAWPERRVLGEADGTGKYGLTHSEVTEALRAERRRQRDLEDAGWTVVRWDSTERWRTILDRLDRALLP